MAFDNRAAHRLHREEVGNRSTRGPAFLNRRLYGTTRAPHPAAHNGAREESDFLLEHLLDGPRPNRINV